MTVAVSGAVLAALGLTALTSARAAAASSNPLANCREPIKIESETVGAQFKKGSNSTSVLSPLKITGCDMEITADHASTTGMDFDDSTWTLNGNVRIRAGEQQSKLSSDDAVVVFRNSAIQHITVKGRPAEFEQKRPDSDTVTRGHAGQIVYEASDGTVRLSDDAWLQEGGNEIRSPTLVYDIRNAKLANTGGEKGNESGERVLITINPKATKDEKKDDKKKPSTPGTGPAPAPTPVP